MTNNLKDRNNTNLMISREKSIPSFILSTIFILFTIINTIIITIIFPGVIVNSNLVYADVIAPDYINSDSEINDGYDYKYYNEQYYDKYGNDNQIIILYNKNNVNYFYIYDDYSQKYIKINSNINDIFDESGKYIDYDKLNNINYDNQVEAINNVGEENLSEVNNNINNDNSNNNTNNNEIVDGYSNYSKDELGHYLLDNDYYITAYDINVEVGENNVYHITENMTYNFVQPHHGITISLPIKYYRYYNDGKEITMNAKVKNFKCNDNIYSQSQEGNFLNITTGKENVIKSGIQKYTFSYDYVVGKDPLPDMDELNFNIIGEQSPKPLEYITWTIKMPKSFDSSTIGYSVGQNKFGYDPNKLVSNYDKDTNTITGSYNYPLQPGEAITIIADLEEGYFQNIESSDPSIINDIFDFSNFKNNKILIPTIIIIALSIICIFAYFLFGRGAKVIKTVNFAPPKGFENPLDISYIYNNGVNNESNTALLIYLADKGYIKIEDDNELQDLQDQLNENNNKILSKGVELLSSIRKNYIITKLKDYDGTDPSIKRYMDGLFNLGNGTSVSTDILEYRFYRIVQTVNRYIAERMRKENLTKNGDISSILSLISIAITCFLTPKIAIISSKDKITAIIFLVISAFLVSAAIFVPKSIKTNIKIGRPFIIFFMLLFSGPFIVLGGTQMSMNPAGFYISFICLIIQARALMHTNRTEKGAKLYGEVLGFKNFIETCEESRIRSMVMQDPQYFYHILPYAYVLGVSDKWIKNFERMHIEPQKPNWYYGATMGVGTANSFDFNSFNKSFSGCMNNVSRAPHSSSSGGSGSGGRSSSGGGSGGGGRGAW